MFPMSISDVRIGRPLLSAARTVPILTVTEAARRQWQRLRRNQDAGGGGGGGDAGGGFITFPRYCLQRYR